MIIITSPDQYSLAQWVASHTDRLDLGSQYHIDDYYVNSGVKAANDAIFLKAGAPWFSPPDEFKFTNPLAVFYIKSFLRYFKGTHVVDFRFCITAPQWGEHEIWALEGRPEMFIWGHKMKEDFGRQVYDQYLNRLKGLKGVKWVS